MPFKNTFGIRSLLVHMTLLKLSENVLGKDCLISWTMHPAIELNSLYFLVV